MSAIARDARGEPVVVVTYRVEQGTAINSFAVVRVRRGLRQNGDVAWVDRTIVHWTADPADAEIERARRAAR